MNPKSWNTSAWYYGTLILLLAAGVALWLTRSGSSSEEVILPPGSLRLVSLAPNLTEILFALGFDEEIVAVSSDSNFPPQALAKKKAGSFWNPDPEAVLSVRPTVVFTLGFAQQEALADQLKNTGCRTVSLRIESIDQLYEAIETIGSVTCRSAQSAALIGQIKSDLEAFRRQAEEAEPVRVLWVVQREPLRAAGSNTFVNELLQIAGAENVIQTRAFQYPPIHEEQLIASAPEVIIETADSPEDLRRLRGTAESFYARFQTVPAVQNHQLYVIDGDPVCRLGPRLALGMQMITDCIRQDTGGQERNHADF